ncbi:putative CDP-diacylglycerol--glycerol-3-phosphate 3-phosphatidyl-transferase 2 [bacterium BMS3Bbin04]|nr:putative CDP-diacylglycerol--glycerol-3-phosphate 3-phosphatidyl-transferase 2 [bacterium BMS3Bbin04]
MSGQKALLNAFTLARIPIALLLFCWLFATDYNTTSLIVALILMASIELGDLLDGFLARRYNLVSELGATLDPYADSIARLIIYSALAYDNLALMAVPIVMAIRDITVAYSRIIITRAGKSASAKWSGKIKAVVQAVGAFLLILSPVIWPVKQQSFLEAFLFTNIFKPIPVQIISWIVIIVTMLSMIEYVVRALPAIRKQIT